MVGVPEALLIELSPLLNHRVTLYDKSKVLSIHIDLKRQPVSLQQISIVRVLNKLAVHFGVFWVEAIGIKYVLVEQRQVLQLQRSVRLDVLLVNLNALYFDHQFLDF